MHLALPMANIGLKGYKRLYGISGEVQGQDSLGFTFGGAERIGRWCFSIELQIELKLLVIFGYGCKEQLTWDTEDLLFKEVCLTWTYCTYSTCSPLISVFSPLCLPFSKGCSLSKLIATAVTATCQLNNTDQSRGIEVNEWKWIQTGQTDLRGLALTFVLVV